MSQFGPPHGPNPGQPPQQWPAGPSDEGLDRPTDPWNEHEGWGGAPSSTPPGGGAPTGPVPPAGSAPGPTGYPQTQQFQPGVASVGSPEPLWSPPAPHAVPKKKNNTALIVIVAALAVLVVGGGASAVYLLSQDGRKATAGDDASPSAGPSSSPAGDPTDQPDESAAPTGPSAGPVSQADTAEKGDCLKNEGTNTAPALVPTECGPGAFQVLTRVDGPTTGDADARKKCASVPGVTNWYFRNSPQDSQDFVLCLKQL